MEKLEFLEEITGICLTNNSNSHSSHLLTMKSSSHNVFWPRFLKRIHVKNSKENSCPLLYKWHHSSSLANTCSRFLFPYNQQCMQFNVSEVFILYTFIFVNTTTHTKKITFSLCFVRNWNTRQIWTQHLYNWHRVVLCVLKSVGCGSLLKSGWVKVG